MALALAAAGCATCPELAPPVVVERERPCELPPLPTWAGREPQPVAGCPALTVCLAPAEAAAWERHLRELRAWAAEAAARCGSAPAPSSTR